jgi:hypothetical protein
VRAAVLCQLAKPPLWPDVHNVKNISDGISDQSYELTLNAYQSTLGSHLSLPLHENIFACARRDSSQPGIVPMLPLSSFLL